MIGSAAEPLLNVSRETEVDLNRFEALVKKWNPAINLVAESTIRNIRSRHILDSAQLYAFLPSGAKRWVDLGSGGGFPGLVIAILAKKESPELVVSLVESDLRKATFLREVVRQLQLPVEVLSSRIETLPPLSADVLSARALAPLSVLLGHADRHLKPEGIAIFPKGERAEAEIAAARAEWRFRVDSIPSLSDSKAAILLIRNIQRADDC